MPSEKCTISLGEPLSEDRCIDRTTLRHYAMCNAWKIHYDEKVPFGSAIKKSWAEVRKSCKISKK